MSWDSYIDNLIAHSGGATDKAAIISLSDGSSWTSSTHPNAIILQGEEGSVIAKAMDKEDNTTILNGIYLEGVKYQFLKLVENLVLGKKKDNGAITMQKSKTAIVIGHTVEGGQAGSTNKAVNVIADYLESMNM